LFLILLLLLQQPSSYRSNLISEAVIGSLPKGLTETEKASLGATPLAMSPALQRLQDLPQVGDTFRFLFEQLGWQYMKQRRPAWEQHRWQCHLQCSSYKTYLRWAKCLHFL
jgi:hypothetical protein